MAINKNNGTIISKSVTLSPGTLSADILPTPPAGQRYYIYDIVMTTNDTALPLITVADNGAAPVQIFKAYVNSSSPTLVTSSVGTPATFNAKVTASASAITAAKTVEIRVTALSSAS